MYTSISILYSSGTGNSYRVASWVNTLLTFTTATHFYRRYHEPDTRLGDFDDSEEQKDS